MSDRPGDSTQPSRQTARSGPSSTNGSAPEGAPHDRSMLESQAVDLTGISLLELSSTGDSALGEALRRLEREIENGEDVSFEWDSSI